MTSAVAAHPRGADSLILRTAARGAALIGVAVVLGIVLLQVVDDGGSPGGGSNGTTPATNGNNTTSTTLAGPNPELLVKVLNGSGVSGAAQNTANELRAAGYATANAGDAPTPREGSNAVQCSEGFEDDATTLAKVVGGNTVVETFPDPVYQGTEQGVNCFVIIGKNA